MEYDTYCLGVVEDGAVRRGCVNTGLYYVYENDAWRVSRGTIENDLGACVTSRLGEVGKSGETYYICISSDDWPNHWEIATTFEYDTYGWTAGTDGEVRAGNVNTSSYYVYENGTWRVSAGTVENNLGACVTNRLGEVGKSENTYYLCTANGWVNQDIAYGTMNYGGKI